MSFHRWTLKKFVVWCKWVFEGSKMHVLLLFILLGIKDRNINSTITVKIKSSKYNAKLGDMWKRQGSIFPQALTCTRKEVAMYVLAMGAQLSFCFSKGTKTSFPLSSLCETGVCSVIYLIWWVKKSGKQVGDWIKDDEIKDRYLSAQTYPDYCGVFWSCFVLWLNFAKSTSRP